MRNPLDKVSGLCGRSDFAFGRAPSLGTARKTHRSSEAASVPNGDPFQGMASMLKGFRKPTQLQGFFSHTDTHTHTPIGASKNTHTNRCFKKHGESLHVSF